MARRSAATVLRRSSRHSTEKRIGNVDRSYSAPVVALSQVRRTDGGFRTIHSNATPTPSFSLQHSSRRRARKSTSVTRDSHKRARRQTGPHGSSFYPEDLARVAGCRGQMEAWEWLPVFYCCAVPLTTTAKGGFSPVESSMLAEKVQWSWSSLDTAAVVPPSD